MIKRNSVNIISLWAIVAAVAMLSASVAHAAAVIYEPFADSDATITGNTPGTGLSNTWAATDATWTVASPSLFFGPLAVTGNRATKSAAGKGGNFITTGTVDDNSLKAAGLLNPGATLWFSFLWKTDDIYNSNARAGFAFGTSNIRGVNGLNLGADGSAFGMVEDLGNFYASKWGPGTDTYSPSAAVSWGERTSPKLIVGKITWATDVGDYTNDTIEIYTPGIDLEQPASPVCSNSAAFDQSLFNTIAFVSKAEGYPQIDEIRFGANYADVVPLDTVAPTLLSIEDDQGGGPIGEDVAEVTYTLTFDKHMDITTITADDFDHVGTATATIGTVIQPSPAVIRVQLLPTTTGTLQLRIPATSVIKSLAQVDLDTASDILDDTTITINSGVTPVAGTLYWDGPTTSGVTDGASQGGTATWDTTTTNWDLGPGYAGPFAWNNSSSLSAVFGGTAGTVTLGTDITLEGLTISLPTGTGTGYFIGAAAEANSLNFTGSKTLTVEATGTGTNQDPTIRAGITGSPTLNIAGRNNYGCIFSLLPTTNVTMTLGSVNMLNTLASNKQLILGGESTNNVADAVTWSVTGNQLYLTKAGTGSWTINSDLAFNTGGSRASRLYVEQGTLTLGGTNNFLTHLVGVATTRVTTFTASNEDAKLIAKGTFTIGDNREYFYVQNKGVLSPGPGVATLTVRWNANNNSDPSHGAFNMQTGSIYEWDVASKTSTDVVNVQRGVSSVGNLILGDMTIKVQDAGITGSISPADQLTVFTYETGVTRSIGTVTIDLPTRWSGTPSLVDDNNGTIYITGLQSPISGTVLILR